MKQKIKQINRLLIKKFGVPAKAEIKPDPVDMLIATILSQNTNDKNSYRAFRNLKDKYKTWEEVLKLPVEQIENDIKIAGLGKQKSAAIKNFLQSVYDEKKKINLDDIINLPDEEILDKLTSYNGVGVKTASCVLLFALGRNVCPVDTHVHRTLNRIGLVKTTSPEKTFRQIIKNIPEGTAHSFHTNLIRLGREICKPQVPLCYNCPLINICGYENKNFDKTKAYKENSFMLLDNV